jgi:hypothetical protein
MKPKPDTSSPKLVGYAKAIEINNLDQSDLNNLSAEQVKAIYNFGQDIIGHIDDARYEIL